MTSKSYDVSRLSDARVSSLLALGLGRSSSEQENLADLIVAADPETRKRQVRLLLSDLATPVIAPSAGPLSFLRLTNIEEEDAKGLAGKTFLEVLTSPDTERHVLEHVADFGRVLSADTFPASVRRTGVVMRALAASALFAHFGVVLEGFDSNACAQILQALSSAQDVPQPARESFSDTSRRLKPNR